MYLPPYAICYKCGECREATLRMNGEKVECFNCSTYAENIPQGYCLICQEVKKSLKPCEKHHVFGRKVHTLCISLCVNCHRFLESQDGYKAKMHLASLIELIYFPETLESEN